MPGNKNIMHEFFNTQLGDPVFQISHAKGPHPEKEVMSNSNYSLPQIPKVDPAGEDELKEYWKSLRSFFQSGRGGGLSPARKKSKFYPALLAPFQFAQQFKSEYPVLMTDVNINGIQNPEKNNIETLRHFLTRTIDQIIQSEDESKQLQKMLFQLEANIEDKMKLCDSAYAFHPLAIGTIDEIQNDLGSEKDDEKRISEFLVQLKQNIPRDQLILPFSSRINYFILSHAIKYNRQRNQQKIRRSIDSVCLKLTDILTVEKNKKPESKNPERLGTQMGMGESFLNFDKLASVLPEEGAELMPQERLDRITAILETLKLADEYLYKNEGIIVVSDKIMGAKDHDWAEVFQSYTTVNARKSQICQQVKKVFTNHFEKMVEIFKALRKANFELKNSYEPELHDEYFEHFNWQSLDKNEYNACPIIIALMDSSELLEDEMKEFSQIFSSHIPVKFLAIRDDDNNKEEYDPYEFVFRQDIGSLAIAHHNCYFLQSAGLSPEYLFEAFTKGLESYSPSLFHILIVRKLKKSLSSPFIHSAACVEGRDLPNFIYHGQMEGSWGSRFHLENNPQVENDWPEHMITIVNNQGDEEQIESNFTFADYAAQCPLYDSWFKIVEHKYWTDDLISISDYLNLNEEEQYFKIPFIWMVDEEGVLYKAAVAWPIVIHCKERLDFWHFIQENGGINNYHVKEAIAKIRKELDEQVKQQIESLEAKHREELETVERETAAAAMSKLASYLLDLDTSSLTDLSSDLADTSESVQISDPIQSKSEESLTTVETKGSEIKENEIEVKEQISEEEEEEEEEEELGEAWIETPLCTTCNECTNINDQIFAYNNDKQAYIKDPKAGPFADIVKAAEKCPVRIIHPGSPQNSDEPDLENLIQRAAKFN